MTANLAQQDKSLLRCASPDGVLGYAADLHRYLAQGRWLGVRNRYRCDARDKRKVAGQISQKHLGEYLAASIPLHLFDGWNYLGRAFHAQTYGNRELAIHLGYYAELRAAMTLLATQGIGVFSRRHIIIDDQGVCHRLSDRSTHDAVWLYLQHWATLQESWRLIRGVISPQAIPLEEWSHCMYPKSVWSGIASDLLIKLGFDLKRMFEDREARNVVTYRPTGFVAGNPLSAVEQVRFVAETIRALEPTGSGRMFNDIDVSILHRIIDSAYRAVEGQAPKLNLTDYQMRVVNMLGNLPTHQVPEHIADLLKVPFSYNNQLKVVGEALTHKFPKQQSYHFRVLSRATLLLRVATGATRDFLLLAGINLGNTRFWWCQEGENFGFWEGPVQASDLHDVLWDDLTAALDEIDDWCYEREGNTIDLARTCALPLQQATNLGGLAFLGLGA